MVDGQGLDYPLAVIGRYESLKEPNSAAVGEKKLARANTSFQFDRSKQSLFRDIMVKNQGYSRRYRRSKIEKGFERR